MLWLALYFPNLPLEIYEQNAVDFDANDAKPLVILDNNRVCHRNRVAHSVGIELGTTLATAHSICPTLIHQHKEPNVETKRLHELANVLYRFSSYVSVQAPDCIVLEISGSLRLFGDHLALSQQASVLCQSLGHEINARVATTPWASIALARSGARRLHDVALAQAGLDLAGVDAQVIERFDNMGIYTLGPLLDLPSKQLGRRFGKGLLTYLSRLTGDLPDPRDKVVPTSRFGKTIHLLQPVLDKEDLHRLPLSPMQQLANELQQWLITHQQGCERLQWYFLGSSKDEATKMVVRLAQAKQSAADILRISLLKLEQVALPGEVLSVGLRSLCLQSWQNSSQNLFNFHTAKQASKQLASKQIEQTTLKLDPGAYELVSEVNARLGDLTCKGLEKLDQHTPESAWCQTALTALSHSKRTRSKQEEPQRPLWLFDPPRIVPPSELTLLHGPERIQSGWWQDETTSRDYYIAQHHKGAECWAFKEVSATDDSGSVVKWYLHGYFS